LIQFDGLVEIRWHGRGGQGAVTSAELVAQAAINEDKYAQAFPAFGAERRGAPVLAFDRIDPDKPIRIRAEVDQPDIVIVLDAGLLKVVNVASGLKDRGMMVVNTTETTAAIQKQLGIKQAVATVDATRIARDVLGVPIVNTSMIGALLRASGVVAMDSLTEPLQERFGRLAERNIKAMKLAYDKTVLGEISK